MQFAAVKDISILQFLAKAVVREWMLSAFADGISLLHTNEQILVAKKVKTRSRSLSAQ